MSARHGRSKSKPRSRSRSGRGGGGKLAMKLALVSGGAAAAAILLIGLALVNNVGAWVAANHSDRVTLGYTLSFVLALVGGTIVAIVVYFQAAALAARVREVAASVSKLGHGTEVRVRISGNDEVTELGRAVHHLSTDFADLGKAQGDEGSLSLAFDPQIRELRDRTVPQGLSAVDGLELDAALSPGSRGGLDYFDAVTQDKRAVLFLVSAEGKGATAAIAVRMARDELLRALESGANARKSLAHVNARLHKNLPRGACAVATLLQVEADEARIYQCGARTPVLLCARGEVSELSAEGIALGLDEGPVFEKGLRSQKLQLASGMRLVLLNEAGLHQPDVVDIVAEHSPKHTTPFMNMVLGAIEEEAGEEGLREDVVLITAKKA